MNKKNCIVYLVKANEHSLDTLNISLGLLGDNLLSQIHNQDSDIDVILFHEESFDDQYKSRVNRPNNGNLIFSLVTFRGMVAGWISNFFAGAIFRESILNDYKYFLRLNTDSYILSKLKYDIFDMMEKGNYKYGYIEEAVKKSSPELIVDMWKDFYGTESNIEEGLMYYTNFEICDIDWFASGMYAMFYRKLELSGRCYTHFYRDGPFRYLGVNLFMPKEQRVAVRGFIYQHGEIYDLTK